MPTIPPVPAYYRLQVGALGVIALHDGTVTRDIPPGFIRNAPDESTALALRQAGMDAGRLTLSFTVFAVETGEGLVLIDTGFGENGPPTAGRMSANLAAAGYATSDVTAILISHFHGDHISGLITREGLPAFPGARVLVPRAEWDFWMDDARMEAAPEGLKPAFAQVRRVFPALGGKPEMFDTGDEPVPGIRAVDLKGHTPGQSGFEISSAGETLLFVADVSNNPTVFARHPDWQAVFDMDPDLASQTRHRLFAEAARDHRRLAFYHAPFPALGTLAPVGTDYAWCPLVWGAQG